MNVFANKTFIWITLTIVLLSPYYGILTFLSRFLFTYLLLSRRLLLNLVTLVNGLSKTEMKNIERVSCWIVRGDL